MGFVNLVSGGLDSTLVGVLAKGDNVDHYPLFIDYGQRASKMEWKACRASHRELGLPAPKRMQLSGFGRLIRSGLTDSELNVKDDAFTPGRNLLFLLMGSAYAFQLGVSSVAIGLLSEELSLFPDQRSAFIEKAEVAIEAALGRHISVMTPLMDFEKRQVVDLANSKGVSGTYSCHMGSKEPCGYCIACQEYQE